jgi:hypothetical protein
MTDPVESIEMSEKDEADLQKLLTEGAEPEFHPVLEVWREVLSNGPELAKEKVSPQWASKIVGTYSGVTFADMEDVQEGYFGKIAELAKILDIEIASDKECLTYRSAAEDALENGPHYKNLLRDWQLTFLQWELDWNCRDAMAAVELAAISEVHKMFFGPTGLTAYLDNIKFEYTEQDQMDLADALVELRDGQAMKDE